MMKTTTFSTPPLPWKLTRGAKATATPVLAMATPPWPPVQRSQIAHSMPQEKVEVFKSLEPWVSKHVLPLLKPIEKSWQPSEFLPDPTKPKTDFMDEFVALQNRSNELPDEYYVVLVGNMVVEDSVPTYQSLVNTADGTKDDTGASPSPWATWVRGWISEENRHGDLLKEYLHLSGRVDMVMVEKTVQYLIGAGMDESFENNPYLGFVYGSFQERSTWLNHGNIARKTKEVGDPVLATICGTIAADEKRHENAYIKIVEKLLEVDPNETMLAISKMMRGGMVVPGSRMYDGQDPYLFKHYIDVIRRLGVYTWDDYVNTLQFLIDRWGVEKLEGLKEDGRREQEIVCRLPYVTKKVLERSEERNKEKIEKVKFSWIFNKEAFD